MRANRVAEKILYGVLGTVAVLAGLFCTMAYAIPSLSDFRSEFLTFWEALFGCGIIWALALGAIFMGIRYILKILQR
jgi:NADH:ubiquinone oxidoreductase subunit 4 (subunit M)